MNGYRIFKATDVDVLIVSETIRHEDKLEMLQWTANGPEHAVADSVRQSDVAFAIYADDDEVLCVCGAKVDNVIEETGVIWCLSSEAANRHKIAYVKASKIVLDRIMKEMPNVREFHNWVSNDYPAAQRWVEWMGGTFSINGNRPGFGGSVFREFYIENPYYKEK